MRMLECGGDASERRRTVAQAPDAELLVGAGENTTLEMLEVQFEGKKRSSAAEFLRGYRPQPGEGFTATLQKQPS